MPESEAPAPAVSAPVVKRKPGRPRKNARQTLAGTPGAAIGKNGSQDKGPRTKDGRLFRPLVSNDDRLEDFKPPLPPLDPLVAAQEEARHAKEGNLKLARAVDILREGLELLVVAEVDRQTGIPVNALTLRKLAAATLDRYSAHSGQNWRLGRNKLTGATRAGDRSIPDDLDREEA